MTPAQRLVRAANKLDRDPHLTTEGVRLVAALLLLRGMKLDPLPADAQRFLCGRYPSREFLAIADLVLAEAS